jgi:FtsP/CotA-like multicopper oxidase with cupredoxin domain
MIHWHGIRLPAVMDGTGEVQSPILPGEEFEYRFIVPDAGTFWYHSHHNETEQMERGMYGALLVEEDSELIVDNDRLFIIDDMKLTKNYAFKKGNRLKRWMERHDGREGSTALINGKEQPVIEVNAGQVERWRIINAASARYFRLSLGGKSFQLIATDGGLIEQPVTMSEILITPGERIEILTEPFSKDDRFELESLAFNRTTFLRPKRQTFATILVKEPLPSKAFIPKKLRTIEKLTTEDAKATREIKLSVVASLKHGIDFLVNDEMHHNDKPVTVGELQVWDVANTSMMDHPFHLHGFFFQVLAVNNKVPEYHSWKDTLNLPPKSTAKIAWIPDNRPGLWMYHCHILEHHAAGMMAHFEVVDPVKGSLNTVAAHSCKHQHNLATR